MNIFLNILSSNFLVEYIYGDNNSITPSDNHPFLLLENGYINRLQLLNEDNSQNFSKNVRNLSAVRIDDRNSKIALLKINKLGKPYNDFSDKLTNSNNLPLSLPNEGIVYDTIRVHLITGFTFTSNFDGLLLNVKITALNGQKTDLLNGVIKRGDNFTNNPKPFIFSGRQYSSYIEFKIPSLNYLKSNSTGNTLGGQLSGGSGFANNSLIDLRVSQFGNESITENQIYYTENNFAETSISSSDVFNDIGVEIKESSEGDFIEYYGTHLGGNIGTYLNNLNSSGIGNNVLIHNLIVREQLPKFGSNFNFIGNFNPLTNTPNIDSIFLDNFNNGDYWVSTESGIWSAFNEPIGVTDFIVKNSNSVNGFDIVKQTDLQSYGEISDFIQTTDVEFVQSDNFGDINTFRPILKFGGKSISYRIEYVMKIFNTTTNSVIEKRGNFVSFNTRKYGKKLLKINPGIINTVDVFNKKVINVIQNGKDTIKNRILDTDIYKRNVTSFKINENIYLGNTNVNINANGDITPENSLDSIATLKGQGKSLIYLTPFDTFVKFKLFEEKDGSVNSIDIESIGQMFLNFRNGDGEIIKISSINNPNVSPTEGEILFKISKENYNKISKINKRDFYITSSSGINSPETLVYTGKFRDISEKEDIENIIEENERLKRENEEILLNFETTVNERVEYLIKNRTENENTEVQEEAINVRFSNFNPFGPTGRIGLTGERIGATS